MDAASADTTNSGLTAGGGVRDFGTGERPRVQGKKNEGEIREQLVKLAVEHRELDSEIAGLQAAGSVDQLAITRLKRRKLKLKDQITALEDQLLPDIIA